jgi:hypothetical protein
MKSITNNGPSTFFLYIRYKRLPAENLDEITDHHEDAFLATGNSVRSIGI